MKTRNLLAAMMVVGLTWATAGCSNDVLGLDDDVDNRVDRIAQPIEEDQEQEAMPQLPQAEKPFPAPGKVD